MSYVFYMGSSDLKEEMYSLMMLSLTSSNSVKALFAATSKSYRSLSEPFLALLSDIDDGELSLLFAEGVLRSDALSGGYQAKSLISNGKSAGYLLIVKSREQWYII